MIEIKKEAKINRLFGYIVLLFAFLCVGFFTTNSKVEAKHVIDISSSINYSNNTVSFTYFYDSSVDDEIEYWFTVDGKETRGTIGFNDYDKTKGIEDIDLGKRLTYYVSIDGLVVNDKDTKYSSDTTRSFSMRVYVESWYLFIPSSGEDTQDFLYKPSVPAVSSFAISSSKNTLKIGDEILFTAKFNQKVFTSTDLNISFKIGNASKQSSSCDSYTASTSDTLKCKYVVKEGDTGTISSVVLNNSNHIKGVYSNYISNSSITISNFANTITGIDGIKPYIKEINAGDGIFSEGLKISIQVVFSENLKVNSGYVAPTLTIKFEDGVKKNCSISSGIGTDNKLLYECGVGNTNFGKMSFVSISDGSGIVDNAGNAITLVDSSKAALKEKEFSNVVVNNNIPSLSVSVDKSACTLYGSKYYCKKGNKIVVDFEFDMDGSFDSSNVELLFGDVLGTGTTSPSFVGNKLKYEYVVGSGDNGKLSIKYQFKYVAENGKTSNVSNIKQEEIYVDNAVPAISFDSASTSAGNISGYVIYGKKDGTITFNFKVSDASDVTFDSSKVSVIANDNSNITACSTCNIKEIKSELKNGMLKVILVIGKDNINTSFKVKIAKNAIKDSFSNVNADFVTSLYTVDTNYPSFDVSISYPQYKGYTTGNKWVLISGETINFKITSKDSDLKDYCVVIGDDCNNFVALQTGVEYSQNISNILEGENKLIIKVRDNALNVSEKETTFVLKNMFNYSNGAGTLSKNHSISVDVSLFSEGTNFKYSWFKKGDSVNFSGANVTSKQDDVITIDGSNSYNGQYMLCINRVSDNVTLCSEYVEFDNKIDKFEVNLSSSWTNENIVPNIVFNDVNTIKCLAVGKNYSSVNCLGNNENVVVYKTSQAISPFNKYTITENGTYYFYIEDAVGNNQVITKQVTVLDRDLINIQVFNGDYGEEYNSNLELSDYKKSFKFLVVFDKDVNSSNNHQYYKYFFSTSSYSISNKDDFNNYYLKSGYKNQIDNPTSNKLYISTPNSSNTYYLYIMASDKANNISFYSLSDIKVDVFGPSVKAYNKSGAITNNVGSNSFIVSFDYSFVVEDYDSKLDLNNVYYNWINSSNNNVFAADKKYELCSFDYNICRINGENIELAKGLFDPKDSYKFVLTVNDNAGNKTKFTSSSFKIDTTAPSLSSSVNEGKWYNTNSFDIVVSKVNNVGTLDGIAYCLNDCKVDGNYDLDKFVNLSVVNPTEETKIISLDLQEGTNVLHVYARDVFGNYVYEEYVVHYDNTAPVVEIDEELDLGGSDTQKLEFTIKDSSSGIKSYCIYLDESTKSCNSLAGEKSKFVDYLVDKSATYYIEVVDFANNSDVYSVKVEGIDREPISFDLSSSVKNGKFTNGSVTISIVSMKDSTSNDVKDSVKSIDYVKLPYDSAVINYDEIFDSDVINVYTKGVETLTTSFSVNTNNLYVVRVKDTANNVSYKAISINNIDKDNPIIDTNTYSNGSDRIYLYGENGNVTKDISTGAYDYSNDTLMIHVGEDSLKDKYTNYNGYLSLNVCFKYTDGSCDYESYLLKTIVNANKDYVINRSIEITAPYDFSGEIYYYVVDGANNASDVESIVVNYVLSENIPVISYATKSSGSYNSYKIIHNEAYVSGSIKLKFEDTDLSYFEVYSNSVLESKCYVSSVVNDVNCVKNGEGEIGFVIEKGKVYYYLNSGNHVVKAYDLNSNVKEVNIYMDSGNPNINVYKKVGTSYNLQSIDSGIVFNSLDNLYIKVIEETFSYMNIDLYNSKTKDEVTSAARYSYVNSLGKCVYDSSVCEYGASINDLLVVNTRGYNQIIVTIYDKASNYSRIVISYDVETPEIMTANVGENVYVNGIVYTVEENNVIRVQIGANNRLTLENLLNVVVKSVDGYSYSQVNTSNLFKVMVYKSSNIYNGDIFANTGNYEVEIAYVDEAGNVAVSKYINIVVEDKVKPIGVVLDDSNKVEIKEVVIINGIRVTDNYGLEISNGNIVKEKVYGLSASSCSLVSNAGSLSCLGAVEIVSSDKYRFLVAGTYTFTYTIEDLEGNSVDVIQTLYVKDNKGPVMDADKQLFVIKVGERNGDKTVNIGEIKINYPSSYDDGDEMNRNINFVGLFSVNNMHEKYKIINDTYLVSDVDGVVTYKFDKIGVYYLRFTSSDRSGNVSLFEYEIKVVDDTAPLISGVSDGQIIEVELGAKFDIEALIANYSISSSDNYDESATVSYDINEGKEHTYDITFTSIDSSSNARKIVVYVDIVDTIKPTVGELVIDSSTNLNELPFRIVGGEDNSNKFYHEYNVQNRVWKKYEEGSFVELGNGLSTSVKVCIRAVDYSSNVSEETRCVDVLVDTKKPFISGVSEGSIYNKEVTVNVGDDRLESVEITLNGELLEMGKDDLPLNLSEVGKYSIVAKDLLGNVVIVNFIINIDVYMEVVNDVNANEYTTTSIDFDKRFLVKADVTYNNNGDSKIDISLENVNLKEKDRIYVLGVVPDTTSTFVMFSASKDNIVKYQNGVTLLNYGNSFKDGVNNEDCLVKINEDYYVYLIIKENVDSSPVIVDNDDGDMENTSLRLVFIVLGSIATLFIGYQLFKFKKRVRAA